MDRIRAVLGAMNEEEVALLAQRKGTASRATWLTTLTLVPATAADIALLVGTTLALQRAVSRRMQHAAEQERLLARARQSRIEAEEAATASWDWPRTSYARRSPRWWPTASCGGGASSGKGD